MSSLDAQALELLTPEERAAIEDGAPTQAEIDALRNIAGSDDEDGEDDDGVDDDTTSTEAADTAKAADAAATADAAAAAPAGSPTPATPPAASPAPARAPAYVAELPADFETKVTALGERETAAWTRFEAGDIDRAQLQADLRGVESERRELDSLRIKAEISQDMTRQSVEFQFNQALDDVSGTPAEQGGINYRADAKALSEFNMFLRALGADESNEDKDAKWFVAEAHKRVQAFRGAAAPAAPAPSPTPAPAPSAKDAALARRKPAVADAPATLAQVPGGDGPGDVAGEFAHLDRLNGTDLEDAIARMTPAQREKYAAGS